AILLIGSRIGETNDRMIFATFECHTQTGIRRPTENLTILILNGPKEYRRCTHLTNDHIRCEIKTKLIELREFGVETDSIHTIGIEDRCSRIELRQNLFHMLKTVR